MNGNHVGKLHVFLLQVYGVRLQYCGIVCENVEEAKREISVRLGTSSRIIERQYKFMTFWFDRTPFNVDGVSLRSSEKGKNDLFLCDGFFVEDGVIYFYSR